MATAQQAETLAQGTVIAGRYKVDRRLGQGGMGSVYLVQHVHTDERLALKLLHSTVVRDTATLDRFRREARTPARIDSDHVVRVTDADAAPELDNVPFLVMEYLRGEDLEHLASRRGAIPPSEVVLLLSQAARGLDKAHALGIVHRDLKPENLFVTQREDGTSCLKILDFGIAKVTSGGDVREAGRLTATGQIFGTPLYMSPEQAMAESDKICPQTDVWALALIAHRLLTGKEFWTAQTLTHLVAQIAFEPIPTPTERGCTLGPAYDEWFARCIHREPAERFKSASEAISALASALRVTDSPSQLARIPVSIRVSTGTALADHRDALADTSASEGITGPAGNAVSDPPTHVPADGTSHGATPPLGRTQFAAEAARASSSKTLGLVLGGLIATLAGGFLAYKLTGPPAGASPGVAASQLPSSELPASAAPPVNAAPTVTPAEVPSGHISVTNEPPVTTAEVTPAGTAGTAPPAVTGHRSTGTATTPGAPLTKPTTTAAAPPTTAPPATTPAPSTTAPKDPLGSRH
ncbi:MAG: protein kinase [Polyangiaceae bacterium]